MDTLTWAHKDGSRYWWSIKLWKSGETKEDEDIHFEWSYIIARESGIQYAGVFIGQYDEVPTLTDVLNDFSQYINGMIIGFAKYANPPRITNGA